MAPNPHNLIISKELHMLEKFFNQVPHFKFEHRYEGNNLDELLVNITKTGSYRYDFKISFTLDYPFMQPTWSHTMREDIPIIREIIVKLNDTHAVTNFLVCHMKIMLHDVCGLNFTINDANMELLATMAYDIANFMKNNDGVDNLATSRLRRELAKFQTYDMNLYNRKYRAQLVYNNIFEWCICVSKECFDSDEQLYRDILKLESIKKREVTISLKVKYSERYPFEAPTIKILTPRLISEFVAADGSLKTKLLTPEHWSTAYTTEGILLDMGVVLSPARILFPPEGEQPAATETPTTGVDNVTNP